MSETEIINDFNSTLKDLVTNLAYICPDSIIAQYENDAIKYINNPKYYNSFIDNFVAHVLQYKPQIMEGNDDFFLGKTYEEFNSHDSSYMNEIFKFKDIWTRISKNNKEIIIQYMQILCQLAEDYFILRFGS